MQNPNTDRIEKKVCYFEFDAKYKEFITAERSDAFVMGLLVSAMENGYDIEYEKPISERLYYQLMTYFVPMISKYNKSYPIYNIKLLGPVSNENIKNIGAVATGCSGGVDSFYTIKRHSDGNVNKEYKLTHLVYSSSGTEDTNEPRIIQNFKKNISVIDKIAKDCNLDLISCYNNLFEFYKIPFKGFIQFYTTTFGAVAYALQKLISVYYVSSGSTIEKFNLDLSKIPDDDSAVFDTFTVSFMNTENLTFYNSGVELSRIEKENYISDFSPAQTSLTVCAYERYADDKLKYRNCSFCPKCLRTLTDYYVLRKIDTIRSSFNVDEFLKHKNKYIGKMMALNHSPYVGDMLEVAKQNKVKIHFSSYLYAYLWFRPIKRIRKILKNSLLARKIYYKFNLDYKLDGYRGSNYEYYQEKLKGK